MRSIHMTETCYKPAALKAEVPESRVAARLSLFILSLL